ncbi:MAG: hypothetical protein US90_C0008G0020 [Candidatus Shapirobacteria bacterium GW2011_GWE2_38_30]|uniref:Uncharacterized protein n=1 Tax=Candidatus Shapirobacteria bacterium GW2011_GWE2_38_30 TaxID=1618490 RepID=A0A0G0JRG4_9BACT|nr:MAG: hypothetical protein US90_C0008G0020 [Candidatus Shapirobacteria bacterium GW2011_GWE2_38_30]
MTSKQSRNCQNHYILKNCHAYNKFKKTDPYFLFFISSSCCMNANISSLFLICSSVKGFIVELSSSLGQYADGTPGNLFKFS